MAWVECNINDLGNVKIHFTPIGNLPSIKENGLLLPNDARDLKNHISPYKYWTETKKHLPTENKDSYTYFGTIGTKTFIDWTTDNSFVDRNAGFTLKSEQNFVELIDKMGFKRYRVNHNLKPSDIKSTIQFVSSIPVSNNDFDYLVIYEDEEYKVFKWE